MGLMFWFCIILVLRTKHFLWFREWSSPVIKLEQEVRLQDVHLVLTRSAVLFLLSFFISSVLFFIAVNNLNRVQYKGKSKSVKTDVVEFLQISSFRLNLKKEDKSLSPSTVKVFDRGFIPVFKNDPFLIHSKCQIQSLDWSKEADCELVWKKIKKSLEIKNNSDRSVFTWIEDI